MLRTIGVSVCCTYFSEKANLLGLAVGIVLPMAFIFAIAAQGGYNTAKAEG